MDLSADEFQRLGHVAVDIAAKHMYGMRQHPVFTPMTDDERHALMNAQLPDTGFSADAVLNHFRDSVTTHPMGNGHPRFFAWANPPPAPIGVIAEFLAAAMNPSCAGGDHAAIYVERCVVRWLMELTGYPRDGSMGILVSGGSMASLTCLAAARHQALATDGWNVRERGLHGAPQLVMYVSDQGHSCLRKSAELMGIGAESVRVVATDDRYRMNVHALRSAIATDRSSGRRPFAVAATAGTVNTGAIDPLHDIANVCESERLWFHIDGAIGAIAAVDETLPALAAIPRADSLALDPHKWLAVPVACGAALVRNGALLRDAFSYVPPYLRTEEGKGFGGLPWYSEYGAEQTRPFRALKLWATLICLGRDGVRNRSVRHRALARRLAARVDAEPALELLAAPELSIVCFRYVGDGTRDDDQIRALNTELAARIQSGGEAFVTGAELRAGYALRASIMHDDTDEDDLDALIAVVLGEGTALWRS